MKYDDHVVGFTCSTFDLFHAGHIDMLTQAKNVCDYLIVALQTDPSIDRPNKNSPVQSLVERQVQLKACSLIDEIYVYQTETDLEDLLNILQIDIRIIGDEYRDQPFTGKDICIDRGIKIWYNRRDHRFSSTELRQRVYQKETESVVMKCLFDDYDDMLYEVSTTDCGKDADIPTTLDLVDEKKFVLGDQ